MNIEQLFAFCFVIASKRYRYEFQLVSKHFKWEINFYILYNVGCMGWLVGKILTLIFCSDERLWTSQPHTQACPAFRRLQ